MTEELYLDALECIKESIDSLFIDASNDPTHKDLYDCIEQSLSRLEKEGASAQQIVSAYRYMHHYVQGFLF